MIGSKKLVCLVCLLFHPTYIHPLALLINNFLAFKSDMRFVKKITPPDFQAKNFTPLFSPNFNSFGDKNRKNE